MKELKIACLILIGVVIAACNKTPQPDPICPGGGVESCYAGAWALWENDCKCVCQKIPDVATVDAGNAFCVRPKSYVSFLQDLEADLDTFAITFPDFGPNGEANSPIYLKVKYDHGAPTGNAQTNGSISGSPRPISKPEGDSIRLRFLQAPTGEFSTTSFIPNRYSDTHWYSLRFEAWVPGGINKGKTLYATMHYLLGGGINFPVRPPVSFEMKMVE